MATSQDLTDYIENNADRLNLRIKDLRWPGRIGESFFDTESTIAVSGREHIGRGSDAVGDTALIKSFVEAFERSLIYRLSYPTTNGLAGHTDPKRAKANAINEVLERYIFFEHFRNELGFPELRSSNYSNFMSRTFEHLSRQAVSIRVLSREYAHNGVFTLVIFDGRKSNKSYGLIIGTALADTSVASQNHALIEALRHHWFVSDHNDVVPMTVNNFKAIQSPSLDDNGRLGLDVEYASWFIATFADSTGEEIFLPKVSVAKIELTSNDPPLTFFRASIKDGHDVNLKLLSKSGMPHPFR